MGEEPIRVASRISASGLPWTGVVTADWTMADSVLTDSWPVEQTEAPGPTGWTPAVYTGGRPAAGGLGPDLVTYAIHNDASGAKALYLAGRFEIDDGPAQAFIFGQLALANSAGGSASPTEPAGGLSLLVEDG